MSAEIEKQQDAHEEWFKKLHHWQRLCGTLKDVKDEEAALRKELFAGAFPAPKEGTQRVTLTDGTVLKGEFKLNRKIDVEVLKGLDLPQRLKDMVVRYKPELDTKQYRSLTQEDLEIFDECLTITPGMPSLAIEDPSEKKKKKK